MGRYIDANKIIYTWLIDADGKEHDGVTLQSVIDMMPTVDVVEVIRCKDCKYYKAIDKDKLSECEKGFETYGNDFCSYGERKGE